MKTFYIVLVNTMVASLVNTSVWFAVTFWVFLQTQSVVATSVMAGIFTTTVAISGFFLGSLVDRFPKRRVMLISSLCSLVLYIAACLVYVTSPESAFKDASNPRLWAFIAFTLIGAIIGNLRGIALSTLVTILIEEGHRDKANGLVGTVNGVGFLVASIISGVVIGFLGVTWMMVSAIVLTAAAILHLTTIQIIESHMTAAHAHTQKIDVRGTIRVIAAIPGLFALIFFHTFNNFLGGVFMSLMDAYGLMLVSVQAWGTLWGVLSLGFIVGGMWVARRGLGQQPLRTLFVANIVLWVITSVFTLRASIWLMAVGMFIYLCLIPIVEAAEQTILQKVVPLERQGRVFGFAQSVEQAASPVTAFIIGPIAQYVFIPFMTTGTGVAWIGPWFGVGADRGLALLFTLAGLIGLVVTLLAMQSKSYRVLSLSYRKA